MRYLRILFTFAADSFCFRSLNFRRVWNMHSITQEQFANCQWEEKFANKKSNRNFALWNFRTVAQFTRSLLLEWHPLGSRWRACRQPIAFHNHPRTVEKIILAATNTPKFENPPSFPRFRSKKSQLANYPCNPSRLLSKILFILSDIAGQLSSPPSFSASSSYTVTKVSDYCQKKRWGVYTTTQKFDLCQILN